MGWLRGAERPRLLGSVLPGGTEVTEPGGRYRFVAPWPWQEVGGSGAGPGVTADVEVVALRTDGGAVGLVLRSAPGPASLDAENARNLGRRMGTDAGVDVAAADRIGLDGRHAILAHGVDRGTGDHTLLLLAPHGDFVVYGRADLPAAHADGYAVHIHSMLASWRWTA